MRLQKKGSTVETADLNDCLPYENLENSESCYESEPGSTFNLSDSLPSIVVPWMLIAFVLQM